jgi:signal transduction histidine kinase
VRATLESLNCDGADEIRTGIDPGLTVSAERGRFRRVLGNLATNALVHGQPPVTVVARRVGDDVVIDVTDDGDGVGARDADRIFDRFFKSDTSRAGGGSGLGLSIAREHARAMGGDLTLESGPDEGAVFRLRLPAGGAVTEEPLAAVAATSEIAPPRLGG